MPAETAERELAEGVRSVLTEDGEDPGELRLTPIPGGASRDTWRVDAEDRRYVLRRDPPGSRSLLSQEQEWQLLCAVHGTVPVPGPVAYCNEGGGFGSAGMLMEFVDGTSVAPRVLRKPEYESAREHLPNELAMALAAVHSVPTQFVEQSLGSPVPDPGLAQVEAWEAQLDEIGEPLPAVELGLRWLRANLPAPAAPALVHGDFRLGNFIVDEDGLAAVIDWELAHLGDPAEDVAWLCIRSWRFGNDEKPVAGLGELEPFLTTYELAGGTRPDAERLRFWSVLGNLKWAVICARQAQDHLTGVRRSHELASLGRRVCEPEWDMLQLMREAD
jgi:aminoglycoside phosphotransferase (APT) family kinase protein